jgi:hypothetical protein
MSKYQQCLNNVKDRSYVRSERLGQSNIRAEKMFKNINITARDATAIK